MKIFIAFLYLIIFLQTAHAQSCNEASLILKPGIWKESSGGGNGILAADMTKEKKVVAALHSMIKSAYSPKGVLAHFNASYNRLEPEMKLNSYYYSIIPLNYYCDGNSVKTAAETSTHFQISVNNFEVDIFDTAIGDRSLAEGFNVMHGLPVKKEGYWGFKEKDVTLGFGLTGKSSMSLITFPGILPFAYVTKKEFLRKRKQSELIEMKMMTASIKEDLKKIEDAKSYDDKENHNDPEKQKKYLKAYQTSKDRLEHLLSEQNKSYVLQLDKIDGQLNMSSEELNQPAIVKPDPKSTLSSYIFTNAEDPFGEVLIKPNPGYFNKKSARATPQFFWITITWNPKDPIASLFKEDIMKAIDYTALNTMLGK
jgi:hypothetical protein